MEQKTIDTVLFGGTILFTILNGFNNYSKGKKAEAKRQEWYEGTGKKIEGHEIRINNLEKVVHNHSEVLRDHEQRLTAHEQSIQSFAKFREKYGYDARDGI